MFTSGLKSETIAFKQLLFEVVFFFLVFKGVSFTKSLLKVESVEFQNFASHGVKRSKLYVLVIVNEIKSSLLFDLSECILKESGSKV